MPTTKSATQVAVTPASSGAGKSGSSSSTSESLSGAASQPRSGSVRLGPGSSLGVAFHMLPALLKLALGCGCTERLDRALVPEKVSLGARECEGGTGARECEGGTGAGSQGGCLERKERGEAAAEGKGETESLGRGGGEEREAGRHTHTLVERWTE